MKPVTGRLVQTRLAGKAGEGACMQIEVRRPYFFCRGRSLVPKQQGEPPVLQNFRADSPVIPGEVFKGTSQVWISLLNRRFYPLTSVCQGFFINSF